MIEDLLRRQITKTLLILAHKAVFTQTFVLEIWPLAQTKLPSLLYTLSENGHHFNWTDITGSYVVVTSSAFLTVRISGFMETLTANQSLVCIFLLHISWVRDPPRSQTHSITAGPHSLSFTPFASSMSTRRGLWKSKRTHTNSDEIWPATSPLNGICRTVSCDRKLWNGGGEKQWNVLS